MRAFYTAVNEKDLAGALALVDENVRYDDLNFPKPFLGLVGVEELLSESIRCLPPDFAFVIDDVAPGPRSVGLTWHVELGGVPFPFGRGCSFVRLSEQNKLLYVRDIPEPSSKPGALALSLIRILSTLLRLAGPTALASAARVAGALPLQPGPPPPPPALPALPGAAPPLLWIAFSFYLGALILGTELPGDPVYNIKAETLQAIADQSLSFFFVAPAAQALAPELVAVPPVHPAELCLFNAVEAWSLMFLPLLATDSRAQRLPLLPAWGSMMFATNLVLLPWCATRATRLEPGEEAPETERLPAAAGPVIGAIGAAVGAVCVAWFGLAEVPASFGPDAGSLAARWEHIVALAQSDRLTLAFFVDMTLYSFTQAWLIGDERALLRLRDPFTPLPPDLRLVPFVGLAHWLLTRPAPRQ